MPQGDPPIPTWKYSTEPHDGDAICKQLAADTVLLVGAVDRLTAAIEKQTATEAEQGEHHLAILADMQAKIPNHTHANLVTP